MEDQCGFDALFVSEVADYLKCVVCHLVLREPIQIMKCGHRFCKGCFERIKTHAQDTDTMLSCPIDRDEIELNKVFEDTGIARVIGNLCVKCVNNETGCIWTGDLRDKKLHEENCEFGKSTQTLIRELSIRMNKYEDGRMKNEKEISYLKDVQQELIEQSKKKDEDIASLKAKNTEIDRELNIVKESNRDLKKLYDRELENLSLKNQLLEIKLESLADQIVEMKKLCECQDKTTPSINTVGAVSTISTVPTIGTVSVKTEPPEDDSVDHHMKLNSLIEEMNNLKVDVLNVNNEIMMTQKKIDKFGSELTAFKGTCNERFSTLSDEMRTGSKMIKVEDERQEELNNAITDINSLKYHVANIENILFCDSSKGPMNIVLKWKLQNYEYHFSVGKDVLSPRFYTQTNGYCFQLFVKWSGENKEVIGVYLKLCRGSNYNMVLEPFQMHYVIEIQDSSGMKLQGTISQPTIELNRDAYLKIHPDKDEVDGGFGHRFDSKGMDIKDMLMIRCTLKPW